MTERFIIGTVGVPFGVKGFVKIRSASGETEHLIKLQSVIVSKDGKERLFQIAECSSSPLAMRFKGIDSPESAKTLSGARLIGSRDQAVPLGDGEFYIEDLKGLPVLSEEGEIIGHVADIIEGHGELVEIKRLVLTSYDLNDEKCLVPFRKEFFSEISPENGRLVLNLHGLELIPNRRYEAG